MSLWRYLLRFFSVCTLNQRLLRGTQTSQCCTEHTKRGPTNLSTPNSSKHYSNCSSSSHANHPSEIALPLIRWLHTVRCKRKSNRCALQAASLLWYKREIIMIATVHQVTSLTSLQVIDATAVGERCWRIVDTTRHAQMICREVYVWYSLIGDLTVPI